MPWHLNNREWKSLGIFLTISVVIFWAIVVARAFGWLHFPLWQP